MDLTTLTDEQLDARRLAVLHEQERRRRAADAPWQLGDLAREAVAAGCDPDTLRAAVDAALTPPGVIPDGYAPPRDRPIPHQPEPQHPQQPPSPAHRRASLGPPRA